MLLDIYFELFKLNFSYDQVNSDTLDFKHFIEYLEKYLTNCS